LDALQSEVLVRGDRWQHARSSLTGSTTHLPAPEESALVTHDIAAAFCMEIAR
jgi:hypothetical protein